MADEDTNHNKKDEKSKDTGDDDGDDDAKPAAVAAPEVSSNNSNNNNKNDFIIRDGFPALRLPDTGEPNIDKEEGIPQHTFWGCEDAIIFHNINELRIDCETIFTARTRDDDQAYSAGITYFLPCQMKPRCALEEIVASIFQLHTSTLPNGTYIPEQSGSEWWTLVLDDDDNDNDKQKSQKQTNNNSKSNKDDDDDEDESDEVGLHFDADYGLEAQAPNLLLHPRLGTVTYLSDFGSPTIVFDLQSPPPTDIEKKSLQGSIRSGWLSHPKIGKHIYFDGRLLHGAPTTFFPAANIIQDDDDEKQSNNKRAKQDRRRITLLVNIWLNHCPLDAEPMEDEIVEQLKARKSNNSFTWNKQMNINESLDGKLQQISLSANKDDPAGSEEVVICGRLVTVNYGATMEDFHKASTTSSTNGMVELNLGRDVVHLDVGEIVNDDDDESDTMHQHEGKED